LVAGDGRVWIAWPDRIVRVEEHRRTATLIRVPTTSDVFRIRVGGGAAWILASGGIFRIETAAEEVELFLPGGVRRLSLGFGGEHLWALEVVDPIARRFLVARYAPENGQLTGQAEVEGAESMTINDAGVWLRALRRESADFRGPIHRYVIRVDSASLDVMEYEISSEEAFFPIGDEVWLAPHTMPPSAPDGVVTQLRRTDLSTGEATAVVRVPGLLTDLSMGPAGLWGLLSLPGSLKKAARVDSDAEEVVVVLDLADIDARPFLRPPPGPIDPEPVERELRDELAGHLQNAHPTMPHASDTMLASVVFEDVRLEGSFPLTEIVILFRTHYRPERLFGRRERIWSDDGEYVTDGATVIWVNLEESIIFEPSLPLDAQPDKTGTVWI
jgi:hypothetical protein